MSSEENKDIIHRLIKVENTHNVALLDEFIAPDFVDERNTPFELRGLESYKRFETGVIKGFPDFQETIEDIIAEGDKVWVYFKFTGTHIGEFEFGPMKFVPTGKKIAWEAVNMWRIVNGKVVERKTVRDILAFLQQLGLIEHTEKGKELFSKFVS